MVKIRQHLVHFRYIILGILQFFDGWFTYLGVEKFGGNKAEGNPIVRNLMDLVGPEYGLFIVKALACVLIAIVWYELVINKRKETTLIYQLISWMVWIVLLCYSLAVYMWIEVLFLQDKPVGNFISEIVCSLIECNGVT